MTVRVTAKTMPGKSIGVERELRWRIKQALDEAGIRMIGAIVPAWTARRRGPRRRGGLLRLRLGDLPAVPGDHSDPAADEPEQVAADAEGALHRNPVERPSASRCDGHFCLSFLLQGSWALISARVMTLPSCVTNSPSARSTDSSSARSTYPDPFTVLSFLTCLVST
ncbi:hypothetical protein SCALM49S_06545 [Streptomyces californicus]